MFDDPLMLTSQHLEQLRPSERRIGEFVLGSPSVVLDLSIGALAERTDTSASSVARFCAALGFSGYAAFRRALAVSISKRSDQIGIFGQSGEEVLPEDNAEAVIAKVASQDAQAIQDTAVSLRPELLDAATLAITGATRTDLYGAASSGLAAQDLQQKLHRLGLTAYYWADSHLALTSAATLPDRSVAIAFSYSGVTRGIAETLTLAKESGAFTIAVTSFARSPIGRLADLVLPAITRDTRFRTGAMASRMAQLTVVDCLFVRVAQKHYSPDSDAREEASYRAISPDRLGFDDAVPQAKGLHHRV